MLEDDRGWNGLRLDNSGKSFGFGQASFDSCYGSDLEPEATATLSSLSASNPTELWRQNLKLTLDVVVSANRHVLDLANGDDDIDVDDVDDAIVGGRNKKRPSLADTDLLSLIADSLEAAQSGSPLHHQSQGKAQEVALSCRHTRGSGRFYDKPLKGHI